MTSENLYLVTARYILGSDSFYVLATDSADAAQRAAVKIKEEDWSSPDGWEIYEAKGKITDAGEFF